MVQWRRKPDDYAVVEVMSSVVAIFMVLSIITAIMLWGVPFSQEIEDRAVNENIKSKLFGAASSIEDVTHDAVGTRRNFLFTTQKGAISIDDEGDRFIVMYSLGNHMEGSGYDFVVSGLDVDDGNNKDFNVEFLTGSSEPAAGKFKAKVYISEDGSIENADWSYRNTITIYHTEVAGDLTDFPVLVDVTDGDLQTNAQSDGDDIFFTDVNLNKLDHEIEKYDGLTGKLVAWVKVPSLSDSTDTILYMYYGNPTCSNQQNPENVWDDNYLMVQHMDESSGSKIYDSTRYGNDGTIQGPTYDVAGSIGGAYSFLNGYIVLPGIIKGKNQITVSAWVKSNIVDDSNTYTVLEQYGTGDDIIWLYRTSAEKYLVRVYNDDQDVGYGVSDNSYADTNWHNIVGLYNGNIVNIYVDGVEADSAPDPLTGIIETNPGSDLVISGNSGNFEWDGTIDEIRISNVARTQEWITTSYNNINDGAFMSFSGGTVIPTPLPPTSSSSHNYGFDLSNDLTDTVRIDLYDDTDGLGLDSEDFFGRVFLFDLGLIKHKYSSMLGTYDTILENDGILTAVSETVSVKKAPKIISEENLLLFRIVQMRHIEGQATGGSGALRFSSVLSSNFVRELYSGVYNVKVQFSGPYAPYWFEYFKLSPSFGYGFEVISQDNLVLKPSLEGADDVIVEFNPDGGFDKAVPKAGDVGGLLALVDNDVIDGEPYVFKDDNGNCLYDDGEEVIYYDPDGGDTGDADSEDDAVPVDGDFGYTVGWDIINPDINSPYLFQDFDHNWIYDDVTENVNRIIDPYFDPSGDASPSDGEPGGLYAFDADGNPYTFKDSNGDWSFGARLIISQSIVNIGFG